MRKKNKILIIEDEPDILTYFEALFQDHGYQTESALDGKTGFALAKSRKPDLITLDITMPNQSGMGVYRRFKDDSDLAFIPIVVITATINSMNSFREKFVDLPGPEGFLTKPIDIKKLLEAVSNILSGGSKR